MTDHQIAAMVQEAAELGPMTAAECQEATLAIRAYARQAWQAGLASGPAGRLDLDSIKRKASLARGQKEGDPNPVGGSIGGLAEEGA